jgi:asparagine synthase (glutamine-hydrolysing)
VDNAEELAAELGLSPVSAEVAIAAAWSRLGNAALSRLHGEWAVLLWDRASRRGVLACDRLGSRTFHYATGCRTLTFGSEARDVLALLPSTPAPDVLTLARWLAGAGPNGGRSFYEGVSRLPGGHVLTLGESRSTLERWWRPTRRPLTATSRPEAASALRVRLEAAVERYGRDERDEAVLLSGGLDSGAVAALLAGGGALPGLRSYSAVFPSHPTVDEGPLVEMLARTLRLDATTAEADLGPILDGALAYLEEWQIPASSPNLFFWLPLLTRAVGDGVRIMLDGEGGDELFGAPRYLLADEIRHGRPWNAWILGRRLPGARGRRALRPLLTVLRDYGIVPALPRWAQPAGWLSRESRAVPSWFLPRTAAAFAESRATTWLDHAGPRWWLGLLDAITNDDGAVLARDHVRRRSRMVGLEPRHPLLDDDVVDLILETDPRHAFDPLLSRPLLREALRGVLPDEVRLRYRKSTFDTIFQRSLTGPEAMRVRRLITAEDAELRAFVDRHALLQSLSERGVREAGGARAWSTRVWRLATTELFLRLQAGRTLLPHLARDLGRESPHSSGRAAQGPG